jgi:DNA-directed RNA polymerase sigma subunit (sigma70/sigma32)
MRALANQSKTIRLPVHMVDKIAKMRRTLSKKEKPAPKPLRAGLAQT